jgi:hypothetical protein
MERFWYNVSRFDSETMQFLNNVSRWFHLVLYFWRMLFTRLFVYYWEMWVHFFGGASSWNISCCEMWVPFSGELHHETFPIVKCKWVHFWATSSWNNSYFNWCRFGHAAIRGGTLTQMSHFLSVILLLYDDFLLFFFGTGNWEWNGQSRCQQLAASLRISLLMITPGVSMVKSLSKAPLIQGEQP